MVEIPEFRLADLEFGGRRKIGVEVFDPGTTEVRSQDTEIPMGDGLMMGRDFYSPPNWTFELFTNHDTEAEAHIEAERVARVWRNEGGRRTPGAVMPLSYRMNGRWRRVYGRPRRYVGVNGGVITAQGNAEMVCDFQLADHLHYDDTERSITVGINRASLSGFVFPVTFPIQTAVMDGFERAGQFTVGGGAPTWPVIDIAGPINNPRVRIGDWDLRLVGSIAYDRVVTIDTRPWARTIQRSDGAFVPGMLHHTTRFASLGLDPGYHEVILEGVDLTGTARATVRWHDANYSI